MKYPVWRQQLVRSFHLNRSKPEAKYFQVASVDENMLPRLRTMVFRGFLEETHSLLAITDSRSEKVEHWKSRAEAELHWYFAKSREQYRFRCKVGLVQLHPQSRLADISGMLNMQEQKAKTSLLNTWENLSDSAKKSFLALPPKSHLNIELSDNESEYDNACDESSAKQAFSDETENHLNSVSEHFTLVVFEPYAADYLDLKIRPHTRQISSLEERHWKMQSVHP
jgi:PPOX class probable FMN-dependent enzyme